MADPIKVVIVDDIVETRDHLSKLLGFENDIVVAGSVGSGEEALKLATENPVDVLLLDINMPGMDGIETAEQLSVRAPTTSIIMMSVQGEPDYLRRAMLAGAREFLVKPFSSDELSASIRQVHQRDRQKLDRVAAGTQPVSTNGHQVETPRRGPGQVVTFFAPKGGVGRTTLAVNFAVAAKTELNKRVALVDGGLQFGDVGVLLNLNPKNQSIADLARELQTGDTDTVDSFLVDHSTGHPRPDGPAQPGNGRAGDARSHLAHRQRAAPDARSRGHRLNGAAAGRDARLLRRSRTSSSRS